LLNTIKPHPGEKYFLKIDTHTLKKYEKLFFKDMEITYSIQNILKKLAQQYHKPRQCNIFCTSETIMVSPCFQASFLWPMHTYSSSLNHMLCRTAKFSSSKRYEWTTKINYLSFITPQGTVVFEVCKETLSHLFEKSCTLMILLSLTEEDVL
jgi:hypothetical protein